MTVGITPAFFPNLKNGMRWNGMQSKEGGCGVLPPTIWEGGRVLVTRKGSQIQHPTPPITESFPPSGYGPGSA